MIKGGNDDFNSNGIYLHNGYEGTVAIQDGMTIDVTGTGRRIVGSALHSEQNGKVEVNIGNDVKIGYTLQAKEDSYRKSYGIYAEKGENQKVHTGNNLTITMKGIFSDKVDGKAQFIDSHGLFSNNSSQAEIGNHLVINSTFNAEKGAVTGIIGGINSEKKGSVTLKDNANVSVSFSVHGIYDSDKGNYSNAGGLEFRALYALGGTASIGNENVFSATLEKDSTAHRLIGVGGQMSSALAFGSNNTFTVTAEEGTKADGMYGFLVTGPTVMTIGDSNQITVEGKNGIYGTVQGIHLSGSQMTIGNGTTINVIGNRNTYGDNSSVYGAWINDTAGRLESKGSGSIQVHANHTKTVIGFYNNGNAIGNGDFKINVVNGNPSSDGSIPNAGTNAYVAGYQGYIAKETTFGGNLDVSVQAYTDKDNAYACGIDNQYGNFEANGKKTNVSVLTKGYTNAMGIRTSGSGSSFVGKTDISNLDITFENDKNAYGIFSGGTDAHTSFETGHMVVRGKVAKGIDTEGAENTFTATQADVVVRGDSQAFGVYNSKASKTTIADLHVIAYSNDA